MSRFRRSVSRMARALAAALVAMTLVAAAAALRAEESKTDDAYVCPPCGCSADGTDHAGPGNCTACRMKLIRKSELQRVAVLIFDGVQIIDYAAPWEVFGQAGFEVFSVAKTTKPVTTAMGMSVTPRYDFAASPQPTILLVPGGRGVFDVTEDAETIDWVRRVSGGARHVLSVCNGAFILAKSGLLDGQKATTFFYLLADLETAAPGIQVLRDQRYVDNGKVITSAGLSSGIDAAIHLVSKIKGLAKAQQLALNLEYDWDPDGGFARGALAEQHMPRLTGPDWEGVEMLSTAGDRERWETRYRIRSQATAAELLARVKTVLNTWREWHAGEAKGAAEPAEGTWTFVDDQKRFWNGTTRVAPVSGETGAYEITVEVSRDQAGRRAGGADR